MLTAKLSGVPECIAALKHVPDSIKRKHLRVALNAAGGLLKQGAISRVPARTRLLKQALGVKVTQKRNGEWYTVVGAKRGMRRAVKTTRAGKTKALSKRATSNLKFTPGGGARQYIDPARYLHLVEKGTRAHYVSVKNKRVLAGNGGIWGRRAVVRAKASRFMAATAQSVGPAAQAKAIHKLQEAILSHANK
jgi:hypothetical protein